MCTELYIENRMVKFLHIWHEEGQGHSNDADFFSQNLENVKTGEFLPPFRNLDLWLSFGNCWSDFFLI